MPAWWVAWRAPSCRYRRAGPSDLADSERFLDVDAGGGDERQAAQALRRAHRHFERDPTAQGLPDDVNAGEAKNLDGIEIAIGEIGNIIDPGQRLRAAEAGMIGRN